jgi:hypothetical protein
LLRVGYGPFLRTLLPGARRRMARQSHSPRRTGRPAGGYASRNGRNYDDTPPRRSGAPRSRTAGPPRR